MAVPAIKMEDTQITTIDAKTNRYLIVVSIVAVLKMKVN
jgi:hypothetical protein